MKKLILAAIAIAVCCGLASSAFAAATPFKLVKQFAVPDGEAVAFDRTTGYVVTFNGETGAGLPALDFYDVDTEILQYSVVLEDQGEVTVPVALEALPNGNFLHVRRTAGGDTNLYEVNRTTGAYVGAWFDTDDPQNDPRGIAVLNSNRLIVGDQDTDQNTEYDASGNLLGLQFGDAAIGDNEGFGLGPSGKRLYVADDSNGHLVEFDLAGNLQGTIPMSNFVSANIDPEGISADFSSGRLFVSMDDGDQAWIVVLERVVPEPGGLGLVGLALLAVRKRRS